MREEESLQASAMAAADLQVEIENTEAAVRRFTDRASLMQSAYTQALGRVNESMRELHNSITVMATVGLGLLNRMLGALQPVAQRMSNLLVRVFGISVWKSGADGMKKTEGALKGVARATRAVSAAQRDLYSFDRITRVSSHGGGRSGSGGRGGGGGGGSGSGSGTGTLYQVTGLFDAWAARAKEILARIWEPFQAAWKKDGASVIEAAKSGLARIMEAAASVGRTWLNIWTDGTGEQMVRSVLQIAGSLAATAGNLAQRFREAWESGGMGEKILRNLLGIGQSFLGCLRNMASATAVWAGQLDLSGLMQGFANLTAAARPMAELLSGAVYWAYTNVLLPLGKWVVEAAAPATLNLLSGALNALNAVLNLLKPVALAVWQNFLQPIASWSSGALVSSLNLATAGLNQLAAAANALPGYWNTLKSNTSAAWNAIRSAVLGGANGSKTGAINAFTQLSAGAGNQLEKLKNDLGTVCTTIVANVQSKFAGIQSALTTPIKNGLNGAITLINKAIGKINNALKFSWDAVKVAGQTIAPAGSVTLAKLPTISKLAEGGIITGPTFSLIGEAGREAVLPLESNTGWMDALAQRLSRAMGGETVVEVHVGGELLARQVVREVNDMTRRTGRCPIYI